MTEIVFHFNVADRIAYACRWIGRAVERGVAVAVSAPAETLERVDAELWRYEPAAFVPHARVEALAMVPEGLRGKVVWLAEDARTSPSQHTLVNLGGKPPRGFESFERMVEVVGQDEADRQLGRERWKAYQSRGYTLGRQEVTA